MGSLVPNYWDKKGLNLVRAKRSLAEIDRLVYTRKHNVAENSSTTQYRLAPCSISFMTAPGCSPDRLRSPSLVLPSTPAPPQKCPKVPLEQPGRGSRGGVLRGRTPPTQSEGLATPTSLCGGPVLGGLGYWPYPRFLPVLLGARGRAPGPSE